MDIRTPNQQHRPLLKRLIGKLRRECRSWYFRRHLGRLGKGSFISPPSYIYGGKWIHIGDSVAIWREARIEALCDRSEAPGIHIGNGTTIHPYVHIGALQEVAIGAGVLIASRVYITDHDHDYLNPFEPPISNGRLIVDPVRIEDYVWLGEGAMVLKGVTIGERSIIGAGSVVTRSIPPFSIAVGSPAKVIRRYNQDAKVWEKVVTP